MAVPRSTGLFVPQTSVWDIEQIGKVDASSPEFKQLLVKLYQTVSDITVALNVKDTGYYTTTEFINGQRFLPDSGNNLNSASGLANRTVFRKVINFGALPNAGLKSVAHNITITQGVSFTRIYATASDPVGFNYIPIPYASPTDANEIEINIDATNVNITTGSNRTAFTITYVVLEFLKS